MDRSSPLLLTFVSIGVACGTPDPAAERQAVLELADQSVALLNEHAQLQCQCAHHYRFESHEDCLGYFSYVSPSQQACLEEAFLIDPEASRDFLACSIPLGESLGECLEPLACGEGSLIDECGRSFREGEVQCPELSLDTLVAVRGCMP